MIENHADGMSGRPSTLKKCILLSTYLHQMLPYAIGGLQHRTCDVAGLTFGRVTFTYRHTCRCHQANQEALRRARRLGI